MHVSLVCSFFSYSCIMLLGIKLWISRVKNLPCWDAEHWCIVGRVFLATTHVSTVFMDGRCSFVNYTWSSSASTFFFRATLQCCSPVGQVYYYHLESMQFVRTSPFWFALPIPKRVGDFPSGWLEALWAVQALALSGSFKKALCLPDPVNSLEKGLVLYQPKSKYSPCTWTFGGRLGFLMNQIESDHYCGGLHDTCKTEVWKPEEQGVLSLTQVCRPAIKPILFKKP